ncbi:STAS domain-containing protein [Streptomyces fragilis]|uniref:Anti-sigma factor antagonist n=1 Tax=Streptomyces fragilis TaxID=67301 RepID=A0ABV2YQI6_9ACTN|nr:STAS domain-containing protein [Streptomyces fragilis]
MSDLIVLAQQYPDRSVITVRGEMDMHTCPQLARAAAIVPLCGNALQVDLSGVSFMDSSGLNLLVLLRRRLQSKGGRLAVTGLQPQPAYLLQITETTALLTDTAAGDGSHGALTA